MKDKILKWYNMGLWSESMVRQAYEKGVISESELHEIIHESGVNTNE